MSLLLEKTKTKKIVLFLCTGDTCRGPMARGYMRQVLRDKDIKKIEVRTAGVMTIPGLIPTAEATQVMRNAGIEVVAHRSTPMTPELLRKVDLILGMTPYHVQQALEKCPEARDKTFLLKEYAQSDVKNYQISDPMGATLEVYKRVYREMKMAIDKMIETKDFFQIPMEEPKKRVSNPTAVGAPPPPPQPVAPVKAAPAKAAAKAAPAKAAAPKAAAPKAGAPAKPASKPAAAPKPAPAKATPAAAPASKKKKAVAAS